MDLHKKTVELNPKFVYVFSNIGSAHIQLATYEQEHGRDPTAVLKKALTALEKAVEINPKHAMSYLKFGLVYNLMAQYQMEKGSGFRL